MSRTSKLTLLLGALAVGHLAVVLAGFLAPYDPAEQDRALPWAPPSEIHFVDADGGFHLRPFVYFQVRDPQEPESYVEDHDRRYPLRLFARGSAYSILGVLESRVHLLGVEEPARLSIFGRDELGRDVFSRLLYGGQISLLTGLLATAFSLLLGTALGSISGYYGRWIDSSIMRASELFMALPWLYLLLAVRALLPLGISPRQAFLLLILLLGTVGWARPARLVRGVVLSLRESPLVESARGLGATDARILGRHVLPQTGAVVLTQGALLIPQYILAEVTLSFLGLGISEPTPSWGTMLASLQKLSVISAPYWWMLSPAVALLILFVTYHSLARTIQSSPSP